jgi:hypothetical protein
MSSRATFNPVACSNACHSGARFASMTCTCPSVSTATSTPRIPTLLTFGNAAAAISGASTATNAAPRAAFAATSPGSGTFFTTPSASPSTTRMRYSARKSIRSCRKNGSSVCSPKPKCSSSRCIPAAMPATTCTPRPCLPDAGFTTRGNRPSVSSRRSRSMAPTRLKAT